MKKFNELLEEISTIVEDKGEFAPGSSITFTHQPSGKKVSGKVRGVKHMSGKKYVVIDHKEGTTYIPPHELKESEDGGVDLAATNQHKREFALLAPHATDEELAKAVDHIGAHGDFATAVDGLKNHTKYFTPEMTTIAGRLMKHDNQNVVNDTSDILDEIVGAATKGDLEEVKKLVDELRHLDHSANGE